MNADTIAEYNKESSDIASAPNVTCHNCLQQITPLPKNTHRIWHTCTKIKTDKKTKRRYPVFGESISFAARADDDE